MQVTGMARLNHTMFTYVQPMDGCQEPQFVPVILECFCLSTMIYNCHPQKRGDTVLCLCLSQCFFPGDFTMKDWCHTNNILQVHDRGCLVVQVHALMTSSMTSPDYKLGLILKLTYLHGYLSESVDKSSKYRNCSYLSGIFNFRYHFR